MVAECARKRLLGPEEVTLDRALGRVLAENVISPIDVPPFANSAMDGFAVRATDTATAETEPAQLECVDESRAGAPAEKGVGPGTTIRISTGAAIPEGADAVVMVERTSEVNGRVEIKVAAGAGENVRYAGEDIGSDEEVLKRGDRIGPAELGVLGSIGANTVKCRLKPEVKLLVTGDELVEPGKALGPGQIYSTNSLTVPAQIESIGADCNQVSTVADESGATVEAVRAALGCDLLIICGGVSVGEHDYVRSALSECEVREEFWGVALKPGKPAWFGTTDSTMVLGLPGNPVSVMVVFHLLARPALAALQGLIEPDRRSRAILDQPVNKSTGRTEAVRCSLTAADDGWHARPTKEQGSHVLTSMLGADALALLPEGWGDVDAGTSVEVILL